MIERGGRGSHRLSSSLLELDRFSIDAAVHVMGQTRKGGGATRSANAHAHYEFVYEPMSESALERASRGGGIRMASEETTKQQVNL